MSSQAQEGNAEKLEPAIHHPSGDGSGSAATRQPQNLSIELSGSRKLTDGKATGPRTEEGKQKASSNTTKHGVFSKAVVLRGESRAEYDELLARLREALQPEGALEELLLEKLATIAWRQRRLLLAETAEIRKNMEFVESDQQSRKREEAEEIGNLSRFANQYGLIRKIDNPHILERCLELLAELRQGIKEDGFNQERDALLLDRIYGSRDERRLREDVYDSYEIWLDTSQASEEECKRKGYATPAECRKNILVKIDEEIRRLNRHQKARATVETARTQLEMLRRNVPEAPALDRLLRYEASLERSFDRTLTQLERLQRMRQGHPVPPPLKVDISGVEAAAVGPDAQR